MKINNVLFFLIFFNVFAKKEENKFKKFYCFVSENKKFSFFFMTNFSLLIIKIYDLYIRNKVQKILYDKEIDKYFNLKININEKNEVFFTIIKNKNILKYNIFVYFKKNELKEYLKKILLDLKKEEFEKKKIDIKNELYKFCKKSFINSITNEIRQDLLDQKKIIIQIFDENNKKINEYENYYNFYLRYDNEKIILQKGEKVTITEKENKKVLFEYDNNEISKDLKWEFTRFGETKIAYKDNYCIVKFVKENEKQKAHICIKGKNAEYKKYEESVTKEDLENFENKNEGLFFNKINTGIEDFLNCFEKYEFIYPSYNDCNNFLKSLEEKLFIKIHGYYKEEFFKNEDFEKIKNENLKIFHKMISLTENENCFIIKFNNNNLLKSSFLNKLNQEDFKKKCLCLLKNNTSSNYIKAESFYIKAENF